MTDLCKNCGGCHLGVDPVPCPHPLQVCSNCKQTGHKTSFCPNGRRDENGMHGPLYFMFCSNCDGWHLPAPCTKPLQQCPQCKHYGHAAHHCPVNPRPIRPLSRQASQMPVPAIAGVQALHQDENTSYRPTVIPPPAVFDIKHVHPNLIEQIRRDAVNKVAQLLIRHTREDVLAYILNDVCHPVGGSGVSYDTRPATATTSTTATLDHAAQGPLPAQDEHTWLLNTPAGDLNLPVDATAAAAAAADAAFSAPGLLPDDHFHSMDFGELLETAFGPGAGLTNGAEHQM